jgi:hypothetical protein
VCVLASSRGSRSRESTAPRPGDPDVSGSGLLDRVCHPCVHHPRQLRLRIALQELTLPFDTPGGLSEAAESILHQFAADEYPHLAETITEHVTKPGYDFAAEFQFGLNVTRGPRWRDRVRRPTMLRQARTRAGALAELH